MSQEQYTKEIIPQINEFKFLEMGYAYKRNNNDEEYTGFRRNLFGGPEIIQPIREAQSNTAVYRTAFIYNTDDPYESYLYGNFFMDFDSEEDIELAKEDLLYTIWFLHLKMGFNLPMESFRIFFSGKKGFHLVIPSGFIGYGPSKTLDEDFKWIASEIHHRTPNQTLDLGVYERRRLFRLENSIHQGTGLHKIPLQYEEVVNMSIDEIAELAKSPRIIKYPDSYLVKEAQKEWETYKKDYIKFKKMQKERRGNAPSIKQGEVPDVVQEIIDRGPVSGTRNETVAALASFYKNQGYEKEQILEELLDWNNGSLPEREVKTTVDSIISRDLNYGINRFKSLAEGEIASYEEDYKEYKEFKKKGRV